LRLRRTVGGMITILSTIVSVLVSASEAAPVWNSSSLPFDIK
jgi:hypothetical protein